MKSIVYILFIVLLFYSCEKIVNMDLPERNSRLVIDGLITNEDTTYYVKLTKTTKYNYKYQISNIDFETGALVIISDDYGNIDTLGEISSGIYCTHKTKIIGEIGRSYKVEIYTQAGKHYQSNMEKMPDVPLFDSIYYSRDQNVRDPENSTNYLFDVYVDWQDPSNVKNYYLRSMSYYWSNQWHDNVQWNWVFNDKFFDGLYMKKDIINESYGGYNWWLRISQYSLTKEAYDFWYLVHQQTMEAGDDLANTTVPLIGNVYNAANPDDYALGYFQVSAKTTAQIFVGK